MFHKRLLQEFKENQKYVIGMVLTQWVMLLANIALVWGCVNYLQGILSGTVQTEHTIWLLILLFGAMVIRGGCIHFNSVFSFQASTTVKSRLRELIYRRLMKLGAAYREKLSTSEAVQISTEGVEQLEIYFGKYVPQFFYSLLAPVTLFVIVGTISLKTAAVLFLCVPLIPLSIVAVQKFAKKLLGKYWGTYTDLGDTFLENLQGLTTLKIYQADERYAQKMDEESEKFRKITMRVLIMQLNSISVMDLVAYGGAAAGMILGILEYQKGMLSIAQCLFIILISAEFFLPLRLLGSFFHIAMNGNAAADKIFAFLDAETTKTGRQSLPKEHKITFHQVHFGYESDKEVLKEVSFQIPEHSFTALCGASGCGKSTIASLLMGEQTPKKGTISIGGTLVEGILPEQLRQSITRVRHDSYLFSGSVEENLRMGRENATKQELWDALRQVKLEETIREKGGLSMQIEEKASNLSGGQKQRLALARAILHNSDIYIFDEATSNIDVESENEIMEVIRSLARTKTVILISHRLANVVPADGILMLSNGKIVQRGTHEELMAQEGEYRSMYLAQQELEIFTGREVG